MLMQNLLMGSARRKIPFYAIVAQPRRMGFSFAFFFSFIIITTTVLHFFATIMAQGHVHEDRHKHLSALVHPQQTHVFNESADK